MTVTRCFHPIR